MASFQDHCEMNGEVCTAVQTLETKLRELVAEWRYIGVIVEDPTSHDEWYADGFNCALRNCASQLAAILSPETPE